MVGIARGTVHLMLTISGDTCVKESLLLDAAVFHLAEPLKASFDSIAVSRCRRDVAVGIHHFETRHCWHEFFIISSIIAILANAMALIYLSFGNMNSFLALMLALCFRETIWLTRSPPSISSSLMSLSRVTSNF